MEAVEEGMGKTAAARQFKVSRSTVYEYVNRHEQGDLSAKRPPGRSRKLSPEQLEALLQQVKQHKDLSLLEHAELFEAKHGVSLAFSTVNLYFKRLGITHKKRASMLANETNQPEQPGSKR